MLDQGIRAAILQLHERGHGVRKIAKDLRVSRGAVRQVLARGTDEVPSLIRAELGRVGASHAAPPFPNCSSIEETSRAIRSALSCSAWWKKAKRSKTPALRSHPGASTSPS
jgi:hypothetical protein